MPTSEINFSIVEFKKYEVVILCSNPHKFTTLTNLLSSRSDANFLCRSILNLPDMSKYILLKTSLKEQVLNLDSGHEPVLVVVRLLEQGFIPSQSTDIKSVLRLLKLPRIFHTKKWRSIVQHIYQEVLKDLK